MSSLPSAVALAAAVAAGDRTSLARAITLVESKRADHRAEAEDLIARLLPRTGGARRVGISGVPGVGKSTFIDALGTFLTQRGHKVAVLAVDPSSTRSGGSILGDKTRMQRLSVDPAAYIRPSPTGGRLGGVARATRETMLLCEAAGHDVVLVETVGTGQSELAVAGMVDFFLALMLPGAGDELQGIKKGILEVADMIAVNKADGDNRARAESARRDYESALRIVMPQSAHWRAPAVCVSGLTGAGLPELWARVEEHRRLLTEAGELAGKRRAQQLRWMWSLVEDRLLDALRDHPAVRAALPGIESAVAAGSMPATAAATALLRAFGAGSRTEE